MRAIMRCGPRLCCKESLLSSHYGPSSLLTAALRLDDVWGNFANGVATVTSPPRRPISTIVAK